MTALTIENAFASLQSHAIIEVIHPGPRGLNALDINLLQIDGGAASTIYGVTNYDVVDGGGA